MVHRGQSEMMRTLNVHAGIQMDKLNSQILEHLESTPQGREALRMLNDPPSLKTHDDQVVETVTNSLTEIHRSNSSANTSPGTSFLDNIADNLS